MVARQVYQAASLAEATNSTTTYQTAATLAFTPASGERYLLLWSARISQPTNLTVSVRARLEETATGSVLGEVIREPKDPNDRMFAGGVAVYISPDGAPVNFEVQFNVTTAATVGTIDQVRIVAVRLEDGDENVAAAASVTNATGTYAIRATLSFTPATPGDYLIIASAEMRNSSNGDAVGVRLTDTAGVHWGDVNFGGGVNEGINTKDVRDYNPWSVMVRQAALSGPQSFAISFANATAAGDTIEIRRARIVALRLDQFNGDEYAEVRARATANGTAYADRADLTAALPAGDHLILAANMVGVQSNSIRVYDHLVDAGATVTEYIHEGVGTVGMQASLTPLIATGDGSSRSTTFQSRTSGSATRVMKDASIVALALSSSTAPGDANAGIADASAVAHPATVTGAASASAGGVYMTNQAHPAEATAGATVQAGVAEAVAVAYPADADVTKPPPADADVASAVATAHAASATGEGQASADLADAGDARAPAGVAGAAATAWPATAASPGLAAAGVAQMPVTVHQVTANNGGPALVSGPFAAGDAGAPLRVSLIGAASTTTIRWGGKSRPTTLEGGVLVAPLTALDLLLPGPVEVSVYDAATDEETGGLTVIVAEAAPVVEPTPTWLPAEEGS
jgi:hypothetical protein